MIRFNYLAKTRRFPFPTGLATFAIDNRIRGPLAALMATTVLTATLSMVQLSRLHTAQRAYAAAAMRLTADQPALDELNALRARLINGTRLSERVTKIRRASLLHANELTWIGNHLPAQTWLATLRYEAGSYSLEGTSDRASAVGATILALHDAAHATVPQLISLHDDRSGGTARVRYTLRVQTSR
jgi:Tfp pilus assembly protein PilN